VQPPKNHIKEEESRAETVGTVNQSETVAVTEEKAGPHRAVGDHPHAKKNIKRNRSPDRVPDNLMRFQNASELMDALQPYVDRFETAPCDESAQEVRALSAVAALNHLKRCEKGLRDASARERLEKQIRLFADVVEVGVDALGPKHLSLVVNAIGDRPGYGRLLSTTAERTVQLCQHCLSDSSVQAADNAVVHATTNSLSKNCTLDARAIALILNAFAKANMRNETLFHMMAQIVLRLGDLHESLEGQNIGLILNAFSKAKISHPELFASLSITVQALDQCQIDVQALSNIVNAFANMGIHDTALFKRMSLIARQHSGEQYTSQSISNVVNAFARQSIRDDDLLAFLSETARNLPSKTFGAQSISTCINGYAKLGYCDEPLLRFLSQAAQRLKPKDFNAQSVAVIVNGCCRCGYKDKRLFSFLSDVALGLTNLDAQAIANIVNAFARTNLGSDALYEHLVQQTHKLVVREPSEKSHSTYRKKATSGPDIAILVASFDKAGRLDDVLLQHTWNLLETVPPSELTMLDVSSLLHTLSRLERPHPDMVNRLVSVLRKDAFQPPYSTQSLSMALLACARLAKSETEVIKLLIERLMVIPTGEFDIIAVISIVGACPLFMESCPSSEWKTLLTSLLQKMKGRVMSASSHELTPSICTSLLSALGNAGILPSDESVRNKMQQAVSSCLARLQSPPATAPQEPEPVASTISGLSGALLIAREDSEQIWASLTRCVSLIRRGEWSARTLPTFLNSYARAGRSDNDVFETCSRVIRLEVVGPGEPASLVKGGDYDLWEMSPSAIATVLNAYSKVCFVCCWLQCVCACTFFFTCLHDMRASFCV
jgi:hypothetical protein